MPFYEYQCASCGHELEAMQKVSDAPLKKCPECGKARLQRLISAPVFRLKGGGWYETDFKDDKDKKRNLADHADADASKESSEKADAKVEAKGEAKTDASSTPSAKDKPGSGQPDTGKSSEKKSPRTKTKVAASRRKRKARPRR